MPAQLIVIGTSLGGFHALEQILAALPSDFSLPIAIVQHRHRSSEGELVALLQQSSRLPCWEVEDKQPIAAGQVYFAPADYHLLVEPGYFTLTTEAPLLYARPAIDVLFESAAHSYRAGVVGIILTGASQDGAQGLAAIVRQGGQAIVQAPATAESKPMPLAALTAVPTATVLPLGDLATHLVQLSQVQTDPSCQRGLLQL